MGITSIKGSNGVKWKFREFVGNQRKFGGQAKEFLNFAYFLLCKTFNFCHFKVHIGVYYQTTHSWTTWHYLVNFFQTKTTNLKFIFLTFFTETSLKSRYGHFLIRYLPRTFYFFEWIAWSIPVHKHLVFLTSLWVIRLIPSETGKVNIYRLKVKKKKRKKKKKRAWFWILFKKLTKWLPNMFFCGKLWKKQQTTTTKETTRGLKWEEFIDTKSGCA